MRVDIKNMSSVKRVLKTASARAKDLTPVMNVILNDLRAMEIDAFRKSVDPGTGSPWQALDSKTIEKRRQGKGKGGYKPLVDTGVLKNSLVAKNSNSVERVGRDLVIFGTNVPYAAVHQDGSKKKNIPKRAFIPEQWNQRGTLSAIALKKIVSRIRNYIMTGKTSVESGFSV